MRGVATSQELIAKIRTLRSEGQSISEISFCVGKSKSIVSRYIQGVVIHPDFVQTLRIKQGGSKNRAEMEWKKKLDEARGLVEEITPREKLLILASLYWGEGTKRELNIINSDPAMLRIIVRCLRELGVPDSEFRVTLRVYGDIDHAKAIQFWSKTLNLPRKCFIGINTLPGKKEGKLAYGMCRVRVVKGAKYFKLILSLIERIKELLP